LLIIALKISPHIVPNESLESLTMSNYFNLLLFFVNFLDGLFMDQMIPMCQILKYGISNNSLSDNRITKLTVGLSYIIS
jgi:hypothetical protein